MMTNVRLVLIKAAVVVLLTNVCSVHQKNRFDERILKLVLGISFKIYMNILTIRQAENSKRVSQKLRNSVTLYSKMCFFESSKYQ